MEIELENRFIKTNGVFRLPAGTLCGPVHLGDIGSSWAIIKVEFEGKGPFRDPFLIIAPDAIDQENIVIPLRKKISPDNTRATFQAVITQERLKSDLWIIPSKTIFDISSLNVSLTPLDKMEAIVRLGLYWLDNPKLLYRSLKRENLGFSYRPWTSDANIRFKLHKIIELTTRNLPDPETFLYGSNPEYNSWLNNNFATVIPRTKPSIEEVGFISFAGIVIENSVDPQEIGLTINSLVSAGIRKSSIRIITKDHLVPLALAENVLVVDPDGFLGFVSDLPPNSFLLITGAGNTISRDFRNALDEYLFPSNFAFAYFDHDYIDDLGGYTNFVFKPDSSPTTLLFDNYTRDCSLLRADLLLSMSEKMKGEPELSISMLHYFTSIAAATELEQKILHIPNPIFHFASHHTNADDERVIEEQHTRELFTSHYAKNLEIRTNSAGIAKWHQVHREDLKVTIVIPTRDQKELLSSAIESIIRLTDHHDFEIAVVDNQSTETNALKYLSELAELPNVNILAFDEPFNFARLHNQVIQKLDSEYVLLLNNDTEITSPDWLRNLTALFELPNIGVVGNKLLYPDGTIQHMGAVGGLRGPTSHNLVGKVDLSHPYMTYPRNVLAVTGACLLIQTALYCEAGGMDENLAISYNDMDLCLSVRQNLGKHVIVSSSGGVIHKESKSRGTKYSKVQQDLLNSEAAYFESKWHEAIRPDPYYSPLYSLDREFELR